MTRRLPLPALAAVALVLAWAFLQGWVTRNLRVATADDLAALSIQRDPGLLRATLYAEAGEGRIYGGIKWLGLGWYYGLSSPLALGLLRGTLSLMATTVSGLLLWRITRSTAGTTLGLLVLGALSSLYYGYQPLLSNPLLLVGLMAANLAVICLLPGGSGPAPGWIAFTGALAMHENFLVWLLPIAWAACAGIPPARRAARLGPFLAIAGVYAGLYIWVQHRGAASGVVYSGNTASAAFPGTAVALWRFSLSSLPPLHIFWPTPMAGAARASLSWAAAGRRVASQLGPAAWLAAAAAALLAVRLWWTAPPLRRRVPLALGAAMLFLPNLLIALTQHYQTWAWQHRFPYYYSALGLAWLALALAAAAIALRPKVLAWRILLGLALGLGLFWSWVAAFALTHEALADFRLQIYF